MFDQLPGHPYPTKLTHKTSNPIPFPGSVLTAELCVDPAGQALSFILLSSTRSVMNLQQALNKCIFYLIRQKKEQKPKSAFKNGIQFYSYHTSVGWAHLSLLSIVRNRGLWEHAQNHKHSK